MKKWIAAARLRTLPLALGGLILAGSIAALNDVFSWEIFWWTAITAILLQILSNFANDYGDFKSGVDQDFRLDRALASGAIKPQTMFVVIVVLAVLTLACGTFLLVTAIESINISFIVWFIIGLLAIAAAIKYTMGKSPYGYSGKGDAMVFIFFGLVLVWGGRLMFDMTWNSEIVMTLLPAIGYGALSVGVLNVNNIRDIDEDKDSGKITLAVKFGAKKALMYQGILYSIATVTLLSYLAIEQHYFALVLCILPVAMLLLHWLKLKSNPASRDEYNMLLKKLVLNSLLFSLVYLIQLFW